MKAQSWNGGGDAPQAAPELFPLAGCPVSIRDGAAQNYAVGYYIQASEAGGEPPGRWGCARCRAVRYDRIGGWNVNVAVMELVWEEPLEGELGRRICAALGSPGA